MKRKFKVAAAVILAALAAIASAVLISCGHKHTFGDEWEYDSSSHWKSATCEHTDVKGYEGEHTFEGRTCTVCGYYYKDTMDMSGVTFADAEYTYDGEPHSIEATNLPEGVGVSYYGNRRTNAGVYTITAKFIVDLTVYEPVPDMTAKLTINKAVYDMSEVTFADAEFPYDGLPKSIQAQGMPEGVTVSYTGNGVAAAGEYTVTAHFTGDRLNYEAIPDMTAKLTITREKFTVTFRQEGYDDIVREVYDGDGVSDIPQPVQQTGYNIVWDKTAHDLSHITDDVVVTAVKTAIEYDIKYNLGGGRNSSANPSKYRITDGEITFAAPEERAGYTFDGWYADGEYSEKKEKLPAGSYGELELWAKWTITQYTITYYLDEGTNSAQNPASYNVDSGKIELAPPARKDYTFGGWFTDENLTETADGIAAGSTGNKSFYAKWYYGTEGLQYSQSGGEYTVVGYEGSEADVVIPAEWKGRTVVKIGDNAFKDKAVVKSVVIPESVTSIGAGAFSGCVNLGGTEIPVDLIRIGENAFSGCANAALYYPSSAKPAGWGEETALIPVVYSYGGECGVTQSGIVWAARKDGSVVIARYPSAEGEISFPAEISIGIAGEAEEAAEEKGVAEIAANALRGNSAVTGVTVESGISAIGAGAFEDCASLGYVILPDSVSYIGENAFAGCENIAAFSYSDGKAAEWYGVTESVRTVYRYGGKHGEISADGGIYKWALTEGGAAIAGYYGQTSSLTVPLKAGDSDVTEIAAYAFAGVKMTSATIGECVTSIGAGAFKGCDSLTEITLPFVGASLSDGGKLCYIFGADINDDLPASLKTVTVTCGTEISDYAFANCAHITAVTLPESLQEIGGFAFYSCLDLATVTYGGEGKNLLLIGENAFSGCASLGEIFIPDGVGEIKAGAFDGCLKAARATIGLGVVTIGEKAFNGCELLADVTFNAVDCADPKARAEEIFGGVITALKLGDKVTRIPAGLFAACAITSLNIPESVTSIGAGAFENCSSLASMSGGEGLKRIDDRAFAGCAALGDITIHDSVTDIGAGAFEGCRGIKNLVLGKGVLAIGDGAFALCEITRVYFCGDAAQWERLSVIDDGEEDGDVELLFPDSEIYCYSDKNPFNEQFPEGKMWHYVEGEITIWPPVVFRFETNDDGASYYVAGLIKKEEINIVIPADNDGAPVVGIAENAFAENKTLLGVDIPESVTTIGAGAFDSCTALLTVTGGEGVTSIGENAFHSCSALKEISLSPVLESIGANAFEGCGELSSHLTIHGSVTSIGEEAFKGCISLGVTVDSGNTAYYGENCIVERTENKLLFGFGGAQIPAGVTVIGAYAFEGITALTEITVPGSVKTIEDRAFSGCTSLTKVVLNEGLEVIGANVFDAITSGNDINLSEIYIPVSLKNLGYKAFGSCKIQRIYFRGGQDEWNKFINMGGNDKGNNVLKTAPVYYYSADDPFTGGADGLFWHEGANGAEVWEKS